MSRLTATNSGGAAWSHVSTSNGLLANQILNVRCGVARVNTCGEVAIGSLEFQRGNGTRTGHGS